WMKTCWCDGGSNEHVEEDDRAQFEGVSMADNDGDGGVCLSDSRLMMIED
ncbi:hypothetical protein Tco_0916042, partial [Tanacetum coccineum]